MKEHVEILKYEETDDGGAIINISLSPVVGRALLEEGFVSILKRSLTKETLEFHRKEIENEGSS